MRKKKTLTLLVVFVAALFVHARFPAQRVSAVDALEGTTWSQKHNGKVVADYFFTKGLYMFTNYEFGREFPGEYRLNGNTVEMHDTTLDVVSIGKINGDKMTVTLESDGPDETPRVYTREP